LLNHYFPIVAICDGLNQFVMRFSLHLLFGGKCQSRYSSVMSLMYRILPFNNAFHVLFLEQDSKGTIQKRHYSEEIPMQLLFGDQSS